MFFFGSHSWRGKSGQRYRFKCVLTKAGLPPAGVGGIYVFVRRRWAFLLEPLYVGKAHDLRNRLLGHEKWGRAFWYYGATERYVLRIPEEIDRRRVEEDLIKGLRPRMNDAALGRADASAGARRSGRTRQWFGPDGAASAKQRRSTARA